ncbi:MAG: hypothetical protein AAFX51_15340, partial [Cyanobacteria bacterium J06636_28]
MDEPDDATLNTTSDAHVECGSAFEEPNDVRSNATVVFDPEGWNAGATLCGGDADWYAFHVLAGQMLYVELSFLQAISNIDIDGYLGEDQRRFNASETDGDSEFMYAGPFAQDKVVYVRVHSQNGLAPNAYTISTSSLGLCFDHFAALCVPGSEDCSCIYMPPARDIYSAYCSPFMGCLEAVCADGDHACAEQCLDILEYPSNNDTLRNLYSCFIESNCLQDDLNCLEQQCSQEYIAYGSACNALGFGAEEGLHLNVSPGELGAEEGFSSNASPGELGGSGMAMTQSGGGGGAAPVGSLQSFSMDQTSIAADSSAVQTLRLTLDNAATVDEVRLVVNLSKHVENGKSLSGYFQWTPTSCRELGSDSYGNPDVRLLPTCGRTLNPDGSAEYTFPFTINPSFGAVTNNQVSGIWYEGSTKLVGWRRLTTSGAGFDVVAGNVPMGALQHFSFAKSSIIANSNAKQVLSLTLGNAAMLDDVRVVVNLSEHVENGKSTSGY